MMETFEERIEKAMAADRFRLKRSWKRAMQYAEGSVQRQNDLARVEHALLESIRRCEERQLIRPRLEYDPELPITAYREQLVQTIQERQVVVVCGETGSGKSTQLPKICLEAGRGKQAMIGHTQPRRLAARSIATRLADELDSQVGEWVGFKIRFTDKTQPNTLVKLMTDGVLLAETQRDRFLDAYDTIIIDEAHERSLNIDLLMGYIHTLLRKRPDLRLVITSATIDAERFAEHFADRNGPAPILLVEGRTYPVEVRYRGADDGSGLDEADMISRLMHAVDELNAEGRGDTLVFMPTERDIRDAAKHLRGHLTSRGDLDRTEILPLYSRLTEAEQQKIFSPHSKQRIVLATNVAESSLTVPGIRYVIDTGTARISRYAPRSKVQRLPIEPVAQASADQRAGRCGRLGPGICIRLFSESDYLGRAKFTTPEIRRTNLASAILQTRLLKVGNLEQMPLLDPPRPEMIRDGMSTLRELQAIDDRDELTEVGKRLGRWPVDPRVGRMILEAHQQGCMADVLIIASALEVQDPRMRPVEKQQAADEAHAKFIDPHSDFLSYLRLWDFYHKLKGDLGRSRLEKACRENFLSMPRLREWSDVHRQLMEMVAEQGMKIGNRKIGNLPVMVPMEATNKKGPKEEVPIEKTFPAGYVEVHTSLLVGLLSCVAMLDQERTYKGAGGIDFQIWPGSGLKQRRPKWIMAAEIVETTARYGRTVAAIMPEWVGKCGEHLLKSSYDQPHFSRKSGSAMVYRRSTLFGLPVVARHVVPLAPVDPEMARRLLIDEGLVERQLVSRANFYQHNSKMLEELQEWATKSRRREWVIDPFRLQAFYEQNLPREVVDRATLEKWDRTIAKDASVYMRWDEWVGELDPTKLEKAFPAKLTIGETKVPVDYHFEPGSERDGVTIRVPAVVVPSLSEQRLGWLVPGLLEEKLLGLIKSLPKSLRRNLVPAPDTAAKLAKQLLAENAQEGAFWPTVCDRMSKLAGEKISVEDFQIDKIPEHLRIRIEVVDDKGKVVEATREVQQLQGPSPVQAAIKSEAIDVSKQAWFRSELRSFDIDQLPESVSVRHGGVNVIQYPTLKVDGEKVSTAIVDRLVSAKIGLRRGVLHLYSMMERRELRSQVTHLPQFSQSQLKLSSRLGSDRLRDGLCDLMARIAFVENQPEVRSRDDFELRRVDRIRRISVAAQDLAKWLPKLADHYQGIALQLEKSPATWSESKAAIKRQLTSLLSETFFVDVPWEWLKEYPRYLQAIGMRLERLKTIGPVKDMALEHEVNVHWQAYLSRAQAMGDEALLSEPLIEYRWMIEEYRVSLFAQQLGTRVSVSPKRLEKIASAIG